MQVLRLCQFVKILFIYTLIAWFNNVFGILAWSTKALNHMCRHVGDFFPSVKLFICLTLSMLKGQTCNGIIFLKNAMQ